ncbi:hypothetical protein T484DRAFT_1911234, partial [Baffinella frigidus]
MLGAPSILPFPEPWFVLDANRRRQGAAGLKRQISSDMEAMRAAARRREGELLEEVDAVLVGAQRGLDEYVALLDNRWVALTRRLSGEDGGGGAGRDTSDEIRRLSELPGVAVPELPSFDSTAEMDFLQHLQLVWLRDRGDAHHDQNGHHDGHAQGHDHNGYQNGHGHGHDTRHEQGHDRWRAAHRSKVLAEELRAARAEVSAGRAREEEADARAALLDDALADAIGQLASAEDRAVEAHARGVEEERARDSLTDALWAKEHERLRDLAEVQALTEEKENMLLAIMRRQGEESRAGEARAEQQRAVAARLLQEHEEEVAALRGSLEHCEMLADNRAGHISALSQALLKESARGEASLRRSLADVDHMAAMCSRVEEALGPAGGFLLRHRADAEAAVTSLDAAFPELKRGGGGELLATRHDSILLSIRGLLEFLAFEARRSPNGASAEWPASGMTWDRPASGQDRPASGLASDRPASGQERPASGQRRAWN